MATSDKTKKLQLLGGFATKKQLDEQYIKTYVLDEGETIEDAPEWAEEVVDPFSESEGGDGSGVSREEFDKLSAAIANLGGGVISPLKKLKCGILGDSITAGTGASETGKAYAKLLENDFTSVTNYGVSGSCVAQMWQKPFIGRYNSMSSDLDMVIVFGGVNDFYAGVVIGEANSTTATEFNGALNTIISGLLTKYAGKEIVFITPPQCDNGTLATTDTNSAGNTMQDYVDAVKERCNHYSIPCLDLYSLSGMGVAVNDAQHTVYSHDGIHPNDTGHRRIYERIIGFLRMLKA